jgi:methyl coenzyme M reductase gamma subunit
MPTIRVINTSPVSLHGKAPGHEFSIEVDEDGTPFDRLWRKRFAEGVLEKGYLTLVSPAASPEASKPADVKASAKSPAKTASKE